MAIAVAMAEILLIRATFVHGPALLGPAPASIVLVLVATGLSVAILLRLPKGRWGI